jgi:hypothetical protein
MIGQNFRIPNWCNRIIARTLFSFTNISSETTETFKNNIKYIDKMEFTGYNSKTVSKNSVFRTHKYVSTIWFDKNKMILYKSFENDEIEGLIKNINDFIQNEIKI